MISDREVRIWVALTPTGVAGRLQPYVLQGTAEVVAH